MEQYKVLNVLAACFIHHFTRATTNKYYRLVCLKCFLLLAITALHCKGNSNFSCTPSLSTPLCPGSNATCTCVVTPNNSAFVWNFTNGKDVCNESSIRLSQPTLCEILNGTCGRYLSAIVISNGTKCSNTSVLTIIADHSLDGLGITCLEKSTDLVIGNTTLRMAASPGPVGDMTIASVSVDQLTVTWTPPTTNGLPTSYNVTINDRSSPVVIADNGSSVYTHTFTGLVSDTLYTVSVVTSNCAGSSNETNRTGSCMSHIDSTWKYVLIIIGCGIIAMVVVLILVVVVVKYCEKHSAQMKELCRCVGDGDEQHKKQN